MADNSVADDEFFGIGEVLEILLPEFEDLSISKIRFLESQGLIEPQRTYSGFRKFYKKDIERLKWILEQQRDHFLPLKVIKQKLKDIELNKEPTPLAKIAELKKTARKSRRKSTVGQPTHLPLRPADYMEQSEIEKALNSIYNEITSGNKTEIIETYAENDQRDITDDDIKVVEFDESAEFEAEMNYLNRATSNLEQAKAESATIKANLSDEDVIFAQQSYDDIATSTIVTDSSELSSTNNVNTNNNSGLSTDSLKSSNAEIDNNSSFGKTDRQSSTLEDDNTRYEAGFRVEAQETDYSATSEIEEFAQRLGCKPELVTEMMEMGFVVADDIAGIKTFSRECYDIASTILVYQRHGFEMRHIKLLLNAAQRESALYLQVLRPILKRRNPDSKYEARELGQILMKAGAKLHQDLLRRDLRKELKG